MCIMQNAVQGIISVIRDAHGNHLQPNVITQNVASVPLTHSASHPTGVVNFLHTFVPNALAVGLVSLEVALVNLIPDV